MRSRTCPSISPLTKTLRQTNQKFLSKVKYFSFTFKDIRFAKSKIEPDEYFISDFSIDFYMNFPFQINLTTKIDFHEFSTPIPLAIKFLPFVVVNVVHLFCSMILLYGIITVMADILYISHIITHPEKVPDVKKALILHYNHCRFIDNVAFVKKKEFSSKPFEYIEHLKSFKYWFFVSFLSYIMNIILAFVAIIDICDKGVISMKQLYLISFCAFLASSDISTVFSNDSKYNLITILIKKNSVKIMYFIFGTVILFFACVMITYEYLKSYDQFSNIKECLNRIVALALADSVKDIIDTVQEKTFGPMLMVSMVIIFYMSCTQIFTAILTIGFQRAKLEFSTAEKLKAEKMKKLKSISKKNLQKYDNQTNLHKKLSEEFQDMFQKNVLKGQTTPNSEKRIPKLNFKKDKKDNQVISEVREIKGPDQSKRSNRKRYSTSIREHALSQMSLSKHSTKHRLQDQLQSNASKNESIYVKVFKILTFDLITQILCNYDALEKFFNDFKNFKDKTKFSFVQVIALSDICDSFLQNLKQLEMRMINLQKILNEH